MTGNAKKIKRLTTVALFAALLSTLSVSALPLRGIVNDSLNNRQPGATIELFEPKQGVLVYSIQTDAEGYFEFQNITEMDYQIRVTTQSYPTQWFSWYGNTVYRQYRTRIGIATTPDTLYILAVPNPIDNPPNNKLTVQLADSAGGTLANQSGMYVALYRSEDYYEMPGVNSGTSATIVFDTLQAGKYAVLVRSGNYPRQYYHPDRNTSQPKYFLDIGGGLSMTQVVQMTATPAGDGGYRGICRSETDAVLAGITVSVCQTADTFKVVYAQTTGSDGLFIFSNIMESSFYLKFEGAGYPTQWYSFNRTETTKYPESSVWSLHAPNDTMRIRLSTNPVDNPATGSISIGVLDSTGKLGAAAGSVELIDSKSGALYTPGMDTSTMRFIAVNIPAGQYYIKLTFPPYPTQYFSPSGNTTTPLQFINVTLNGNLYFEANLQKNPGQTTTTSGYGTVKGSVKDSTGNPLGDVMVMVYDRNFKLLKSTGTTTDGQFYCAGVPAGMVFVGMKSAQYQLQFYSPQGMTFTQSTAAPLPLGTIDTLSVNATLVRSTSTNQPTDTTTGGTGGTVRGKAIDNNTGKPLPNVRIVLADYLPSGGISPRNFWSPWTTFTDSSGNYIISNVPSGSYRAMAEADSLGYVAQFFPKTDIAANAKVFSMAPGTTMIADFPLRKGGMVRGSVITSAGSPIVDAHVNISNAGGRFFDARTGPDGIYTISGVPGGIWNFWVNHGHYLAADNNMKREYSVAEGSTTAIAAITMEQGGHISGTFASPVPLNDTSFSAGMYQGSLLCFSDTVRSSGGTVWPSSMTSVRLESGASSGYNGSFLSDAVKPGTYRMIFAPFSSYHAESTMPASALVPRQCLGYSFIGAGSSFTSATPVRVNADDTAEGLVLTLRKGWALPGTLKDETGALLGANSGVEIFVRQDSLYVRIGYASVTANGRFELAGLIENEEYYLMLWAPGFPSQFWGTAANTAAPATAYRFTAGSFQPLELTIRRSVTGIDPGKMPSPVSLWIKDDSLGTALLAWSSEAGLSIDNFLIYSSDRSGNVSQLASIPRLATTSSYSWRDTRTLATFREYLVVGKGANLLVRSNRGGYDPRNRASASSSGLWLEAFSDRWGIQLEWGNSRGLTFTDIDSVNVFRAIGTEAPKLLLRRPARETMFSDSKWGRGDSGKTFAYYIELPAKQLVSPRVYKTLDAPFFAALARTLTVGPYETYRRISDAVAAASDFDHIEIRSGTYAENVNFGGKNISINGSWEYGKPPVIDGGGSVAFTIPSCKNGREWDRPRISGILIRNASIGIKSQMTVDVEECCFDNVTVALSMSIDSAAMTPGLVANPFRSNTLDGQLRHCTFIAKKPGNIIATALSTGIAEQSGYSGVYSGREWYYIIPAVSLSSSISIEQSIAAFYQSNGMQSSLPVSLQGNTTRIRVNQTNFWKTSVTRNTAGIELQQKITSLDPQFVDSTTWFLLSTSPLAATTYENRPGYDVRTLRSNNGPSSNGIRPGTVRNFTAATVSLNSVLLRWSAAPAEESVTHYRIYRLPGDPALFYINQESQWDLKIPEDSMFSIMDSFSTAATIFLDTTVAAGKPYLYVVAAIDTDGNEGEIRLPAPPDISTYFVNKPADRIPLAAGKWQMIGTQGALPINLTTDSRHALFDWDGSRVADKTIAHYDRVFELQATKGYWFKPAADTVLTMSAPSFDALKQIESTAAVRLIKGANGWNLISSPFTYAIAPEWLGTYAAWEWNADSIGYRKAAILRPWKAYWIYTERDTTLQLTKKQPLSYYVARPLAKTTAASALWQLRITLQNGKSWDCDNYIGLMPDVLAKSKQLASPEPPAPFDGAQLYIIDQDNSAVESQPLHLAQLYKTATKSGAALEWMIGIGKAATGSKLSIEGVNDLPDNLYAFWVEKDRVINLREQVSIDIAAHASETSGFIVVTATPGDLALYTGKLALLTPFPNPFVGSATIRYVLPYTWANGDAAANGGRLPVTLTLYNIGGKQIASLVNERRGPGVYHTVWNGENRSGRQVAAGMYIMRLTYGTSVRTARLYRMR